MRRFYQQEWHGIPFRQFARLSSTELAGAEFYGAFYKAFFERYGSPQQLEPGWLTVKEQTLDFLKQHPAMQPERRILSLGCGLGIIEGRLLDLGYRNLEINEVSREPLRWIAPRLPEDRVHVGFFPACVPADRTYDVILLIGIDGVFDDPQLVAILRDVRSRLRPGGTCILLSWSHHVGRSAVTVVMDAVKDGVKLVLDRLRVRPLGQFWGYTRSASEIKKAVRSAGFARLSDGMLDQQTRFPTYWITASVD